MRKTKARPSLVRSYIEKHGLAGVRLFGGREADGTMPWLNSPRALQTWAVADEYGIVMDLEVLAIGGRRTVGCRPLSNWRDASRTCGWCSITCSNRRVEDDNYGFDERFVPLAAEPNIFFKFTSINLDIYRETDTPADQVLRRAVDMFGADRIMWGSDIGTSSGTYQDMVQRILDATVLLTDAERHAVLYETGKKVFVKGGVRA